MGIFVYMENLDFREIVKFYPRIQEMVEIYFLQFSISANQTLD